MEVDEQLLEVVWDMTPAYPRRGCAMRPEQVLNVIDVDELEFDWGALFSPLRHEGQVRSCAQDIPIGERFSRAFANSSMRDVGIASSWLSILARTSGKVVHISARNRSIGARSMIHLGLLFHRVDRQGLFARPCERPLTARSRQRVSARCSN